MVFPLSALLMIILFCLKSDHHVIASKPDDVEHSGRVKGYYPSYHANGHPVTQINYSLYTDLIFFAVIPKPGNRIDFDPELTRSQGEKLAHEFVAQCKQHYVKPHVSFGGWIGSRSFSELTATASARKNFAKEIVRFSKQYGFVGIDLDWEYPNSAGIGCNSFNPQDTTRFGLLTKEIRILWPEVQITAAIGINGLIGSDGKAATTAETSLLVENLNYINLMTYDVYGGWSATTGPIAPLQGTCDPAAPGQSIETAHQASLKQGFKPHQIFLGVPTYAKRLELLSPKLEPTTVNGKTSYYYQKHTQAVPPGGRFDDKPKVDVCGIKQNWGGSFLTKELISNGWLSRDQRTGLNGYKRHFDECSGQPFLTNGKYFISYDDETSTVRKAQFAKAKKLAGIFFFDTQGPPDTTVKASRQIFTLKNVPDGTEIHES